MKILTPTHVVALPNSAPPLPNTIADPPMTMAAYYAVLRVVDPTPGIAYGPPSAVAVQDAAAALPAFEEACQPATRELVREWLETLAVSVAVAPGQQEFELRLGVVLEATCDLPSSVFNRDTLRRALRTFKFWPTAAEVDELLRPVGEPLLRKQAALRTVAAYTSAEPEPPPPKLSLAERDRIVARFRRMLAEQATAPVEAPEEPPKPPRAAYATQEQLIVLMENQARSNDPGLRKLAEARLAELRAEGGGGATAGEGATGHHG